MSETLEPALPDHLDEQADRLMHEVCDRKLRIATAESCTGGMLAALLTDIEGASHGFERGFIAYTEQSKSELLGINPDLLKRNEAVSEVVAKAMAEGALAHSHADFHRVEHFGALGRGPVRVKSLEAMLNMLEQAHREE